MDQCTHEIRAEYWKKIIHVGYFVIFRILRLELLE